MRRVHLLCSLLGLLLVVSVGLVVPPATPTAALSDKPVMAFYYPWYELTDWTYDRMSDLPVPRYSGGDDETLKRHIQQADAAGIDAFICTWYGPDEPRLNARCLRLMQLATEMGSDLKVAVIPDQSAWAPLQSVDGLASALVALKRDFMGQANYLTFRDKPAVFWFNPPSLGDAATWQQVRDKADPNREQFWFGGTDNSAYLSVYDTLYFFDITWETQPGAAMESYSTLLDGTGRPFIATVMPGYDDTRLTGRQVHQRDRQDGAYYRGTWQDAIRYNADAVVVTSFNEFFEGSHIEPSEAYGDLYLTLTTELSSAFHQNVSQPDVTAIPSESPTTTTTLTPTRETNPTTPPTPETGCRDFPATGFTVCGRLLEYWNQNGGLPVFGYPITPQREEVIEGQQLQVQWFERNRLELHPENARPYDVLLGLLGSEAANDHTGTATDALAGNCYRIPTAQYDVCGAFLDAWHANGLDLNGDGRSGATEDENLALFGLPVLPPRTETLEGNAYTVQWFERARFEWHPETNPPTVLFGLLGNETFAKQ